MHAPNWCCVGEAGGVPVHMQRCGFSESSAMKEGRQRVWPILSLWAANHLVTEALRVRTFRERMR